VKGPSEEIREAAVTKMKELLAVERGKAAVRSNGNDAENPDISMSRNPPPRTNSQSRGPPPRTNSHSRKPPSRNSSQNEKTARANEFPTLPIGVTPTKISAKNSVAINKKKTKVDSSINEGTEAGKNLFAMLVADD
jgi:hypothetical protein